MALPEGLQCPPGVRALLTSMGHMSASEDDGLDAFDAANPRSAVMLPWISFFLFFFAYLINLERLVRLLRRYTCPDSDNADPSDGRTNALVTP